MKLDKNCGLGVIERSPYTYMIFEKHINNGNMYPRITEEEANNINAKVVEEVDNITMWMDKKGKRTSTKRMSQLLRKVSNAYMFLKIHKEELDSRLVTPYCGI